MDNDVIQNAESKLELLNNDEKAREIAEIIADAERNERSALAHAKKEGIAQNTIKIIKKMLTKNMDINIISEITETSVDKILEIKNNL